MMICGIATPMVTPSKPPTPESTTVSIRNCWVMSRRFAPEGAADADLAGALGDGREHDVHDADAADQERDRGDRAEDDAELPGRALGFEQKLVGHDDIDVFLGVPGLDSGLDDRVRGADLVDRADLKRDLRELGLLGLHRARAAVHDPLAEAELAGVQGDVDILVEVLTRQAAADRRRGWRAPWSRR